MNNIIKGGESIEFESSFMIYFNKSKIESKFRNEHTDGKFVTQEEYNRIIRRKKLKQIYEKNS